ncbi:MAG: sodium:solute symporter, partial [Firmicutes bacterium]|nr:sodium:solute symporter [Bacillota bacterium]
MLLKAVLLVAFFAVMLMVGFVCRRQAYDVSGFVLGGRKAGSWLTAFAYGTSYFSAVIFVGYAGQFGWKFGVASTWVGLGNAFIGSLLAWVILGRRTRLLTQQLDSSTMPEFFGKRFGSGALKTAASVIVFIFLVPYTASLYNGLSRLFAMAFDIDYTWCVLMMAVLTGAYVLLGGYMATAVNDFIQGIIMIFGIILVVGAVLNDNGGFMNALITLSKVEEESGAGLSGSFVSFFGPQPLNLLGVVLLTSLGTWGLPQMVGKFYAIRSESAIAKGTVISTVFAFVVAGGCYFLGGFGRLYGESIEYTASGTPVYDSIIPAMLSTLPDIIISVVVILVMSASMSTLSSLVITSSSTLTLDIIVPLGEALRRSRSAKHPAQKDTSCMQERGKLLCLRLLVVFF